MPRRRPSRRRAGRSGRRDRRRCEVEQRAAHEGLHARIALARAGVAVVADPVPPGVEHPGELERPAESTRAPEAGSVYVTASAEGSGGYGLGAGIVSR